MSSNVAIWTGRVLSGLVVLFMVFDGGSKVVANHYVVESMKQMGWDPGVAVPLGAVILAFTLLYAIPRTAIFGAVCLSAFLGGATCENVHQGRGGWIAFPIAFAVIAWVGLYLRDARVRAIAPWR